MFEIEEIHALASTREIEQYIESDPSSLLYVSSRFMRLVSLHLNAHPSLMIARQENQIRGVLPYMCKEGPWGAVFNSLPYYGSNGAVVQMKEDAEAKKALIDAFYTKARQEGAACATIITNPLKHDADFYKNTIATDFLDERIGQITHLPIGATEEELMRLFDDPRPRNIRRAQREGIHVELRRDKDSLDFVYRTHVENIQAIGGLPKQKSFFDLIPEIMEEDDWAVYLAVLNGEPVAGLLLFYYNRTVEYFTPVIIERFRSTQALALAIFRAMHDALQNGYANWNWGGTWLSQTGVYDFKKRWGTSEYRYFYFTRLFNKELLASPRELLLQHYPGFFTVPFTALHTKGGIQ